MGAFSGYDPNQPFAPPQQPIDANSIIENIQRLQELGAQMGIQMPGVGPLPKPVYSGVTSSAPTQQRRREPCRDYETKGFCSRGNKCQYDHGNGSVFVPSFVAPPGDEYDPKNAAMGMTEHPGQPVKPQDVAPNRVPSASRHDKKQKRKARRSSFSAEGSSHDKTNTKIVVENIPEEKFTEDAVREFFTEFGTVDEISLRPGTNTQRRIATVKFDSWAAANAAWKSPKVVFDNRFVKIYWYKDESQLGSNAKKANGSKKGSANGEGTPAEPEFDMEEFKRKQEEAQKLHLEKQQRRETLERERLELEEKRKELLARQEQEKRKLQAKLAANGLKEDSPSPILTKLTTDGAKSSQAEALRAKLAALEQEANSLGLDPDAAADDSSWPPQGGRGRPYRGRGTYVPRSSRGGYGYRGRGGAGPDIHAAYASYSLDNRPKIISITGADFTEPAKDEALRQYLFVSSTNLAHHYDNTCVFVLG
jgi:RNA-binding protein 26